MIGRAKMPNILIGRLTLNLLSFDLAIFARAKFCQNVWECLSFGFSSTGFDSIFDNFAHSSYIKHRQHSFTPMSKNVSNKNTHKNIIDFPSACTGN